MTALKAALVAASIACLPAIAYVLTYSAAHWPVTLAVGLVCAVAAGACFGVYFRFASAFVHRSTFARRMRVATAGAAPILPDPIEEAEAELEARFAELDRRA